MVRFESVLKKTLFPLFLLVVCIPCLGEYNLEKLTEEFEVAPMEVLPKVEAALKEASEQKNTKDVLELLLMKMNIATRAGIQDMYFEVSKEGLALAEQVNDFEYWFEFSLGQADAFSQMTRWSESKALYERIISRVKKEGDAKQMAFAKGAYGLSCYYNHELNKALELMLPAYEVMLAEEMPEIRFTLANIALVYDATGQHEKAIEYYLKSFEFYDEEKLEVDASVTYFNIGLAYLNMREYDKAEPYFKRTMDISSRNNIIQGTAFASGQLGILEFKRNNFESALNYLKESVSLARSLKNDRLIARSSVHLLMTHCELNQFNEAIELERWIDLHIKPEKNVELERMILAAKTKLYLALKDFEQASFFFKSLEKATENFIDEKIDRQLSEMQVKFNTEIKDKENEILKQQNQLQNLSLVEQRNKTIIYIMISLLMLLVITFMFIYLKRERLIKRRFESMAMVDELTGVANRRAIMNVAQDEMERFRRYGHPITYCVMDLDFFKNINDSYGHDVGDRVLVEFAKTVASIIREQDKFGRIGGEEWLLLLPNTPVEKINILFERIQQQLKQLKIDSFDGTVTFSMGCSEPLKDDVEATDVIKRADEALYQAKENGRDEFVVG